MQHLSYRGGSCIISALKVRGPRRRQGGTPSLGILGGRTQDWCAPYGGSLRDP